MFLTIAIKNFTFKTMPGKTLSLNKYIYLCIPIGNYHPII